MQVLGRVLPEEETSRGPDVEWSVEVPAPWLNAGTELNVRLPRRMTCARCSGGGCDRCERRGAIEVVDEGAAPQSASFVVSDVPEGATAVKVRIPDRGGAAEGASARGYLVLTLRVSETPSTAVQLLSGPVSPEPRTVPPWLVWVGVGSVVVVLLLLLSR